MSNHNLLFHTICATTSTAGRPNNLVTQAAPAWSAVGDAIRALGRKLRRMRHKVW